MIKIIGIFVLCFLLVACERHKACKQDIAKFCSGSVRETIFSCLNTHKAELSANCAKLLDERSQTHSGRGFNDDDHDSRGTHKAEKKEEEPKVEQQNLDACRADHVTLCTDETTPTSFEAMVNSPCFKSNQHKLNKDCAKAVQAHATKGSAKTLIDKNTHSSAISKFFFDNSIRIFFGVGVFLLIALITLSIRCFQKYHQYKAVEVAPEPTVHIDDVELTPVQDMKLSGPVGTLTPVYQPVPTQ